eukprot:scaffold9676_cov42-Phaeocystis_antarctica.AAC.2
MAARQVVSERWSSRNRAAGNQPVPKRQPSGTATGPAAAWKVTARSAAQHRWVDARKKAWRRPDPSGTATEQSQRRRL